MYFYRVATAAIVALAAVSTGSHAATVNGGSEDFVEIAVRGADLAASQTNPVINNSGQVAYYSSPALNVYTEDRIIVRDTDGTERVFQLPDVTFDGTNHTLDINNSGQVATLAIFDTSAGYETRLLLIEPDGSYTTVLTSGLREIRTVDLNDGGDMVITRSILDGSTSYEQVVRVENAKGSVPLVTVLDTETASDNRNLYGYPSINDQGFVAWGVDEDGYGSVIYADFNDGAGMIPVFDVPDIGGQISPVLNNEGQVLVGRGSTTLMVHELADPDIESYSVAYSTSYFTNYDINDYSQVAAGGGPYTNNLYMDGELVVSVGDMVGEWEVAALARGGAPRTAQGQFLNDSGQWTFEATMIRRDPATGAILESKVSVFRVDPLGSTVENAILPSAVVDDMYKVGFDLVNALGFEDGSPIYIDPPFEEGLSYAVTNGGPNIISLVIPEQTLGDSLSMFDVVFGGFTVTISFGETLYFTDYLAGGIGSFKIFGSNNEYSSEDFVVGLTFASLGRVELDIANVDRGGADPSAIPLPAGTWLLLGSLFVLGGSSQRRA